MGKQSRARILGDHQAMAIARNIRVSPRKLNLVAQQIRGKKASAPAAKKSTGKAPAKKSAAKKPAKEKA